MNHRFREHAHSHGIMQFVMLCATLRDEREVGECSKSESNTGYFRRPGSFALAAEVDRGTMARLSNGIARPCRTLNPRIFH